ncbi:hypothetical protein PC129_g9088 [Phytophthora cactorum]|uniref:Uncharacterized protein n=1 Tax=Phytophthora cactorum TaxID=29920 RepID=A0A8T1I4X7_9STRA|nr:hypothetical protein PC112_g10911 [Phytophthora cactorum]KAG2942487.1 hypothetical protein PC117_g9763 [Phytophthora cactorum]KAG3006345.1 hypothetical protein PC119_g15010 [Phytophthora cactorum]KAG3068216.1 hypothetical protein PC121_g10273 [Phytophthora cactorum]KAG3184433.1 hypothetical protein PC128_g13733 [Phytophthora cactorum]
MYWMDARHCVEALTTADKLEDVHVPSAQHIPEMEAKTIAEAPVKTVGKAMPA